MAATRGAWQCEFFFVEFVVLSSQRCAGLIGGGMDADVAQTDLNDPTTVNLHNNNGKQMVDMIDTTVPLCCCHRCVQLHAVVSSPSPSPTALPICSF